jgi:hypothetical protein
MLEELSGKEKGISEGGQEQEFEPIVPKPESGRFEGEFGFGIAKSHFNLPSTGISENNRPSVVVARKRLIGEEVPGGVALTGTSDDQEERPRISGMGDWSIVKAILAEFISSSIPQKSGLQRAFALTDFPSEFALPVRVGEFVPFRPAQDKT